MRSVPPFLYQFLNSAEAVRLVSYQDSAGVWTVGVGHTGPDIVRDMRITQVQSDNYLRFDVARAVAALYRIVHADVLARLTAHEYAALISFVFNLGANPRWGIWRTLNSGNLAGVPSEMMRFCQARVHGRMQVLRGLQTRRSAEVALWNHADVPNAVAVVTPHIEEALTSSVVRAADTPPLPAPGAQPLMSSRTMWAGGVTVASGIAAAVNQVQGLVNPQVINSTYLANIAGILAVVSVVAGAVVMLCRWLDERAKHH